MQLISKFLIIAFILIENLFAAPFTSGVSVPVTYQLLWTRHPDDPKIMFWSETYRYKWTLETLPTGEVQITSPYATTRAYSLRNSYQLLLPSFEVARLTGITTGDMFDRDGRWTILDLQEKNLRSTDIALELTADRPVIIRYHFGAAKIPSRF